MTALRKFLTDERATETVEWSIIIGIVGAVSIVVILSIASWITQRFATLEGGLAATSSP